MIRVVIKTIMFVFSEVSSVDLNSHPRMGISERMGTRVSVTELSFFIRPLITMVMLSFTLTVVFVLLVSVIGAEATPVAVAITFFTSCFMVSSIVSSSTTWGRIFSLIPTSL